MIAESAQTSARNSASESVAPPILPAAVRCIVTFHHKQIGDLLFSLPALRALRERWPGAKIVSVAVPSPAAILRASPLVDEVISAPKAASGTIQTVLSLRRLRPELAVCFSQSDRTMIMAGLSGARERIGFSSGRWSRMLSHVLPKTGSPSLSDNLRLVEWMGCPPPQRDFRGLLPVGDDDRAAASGFLEAAGVAENETLIGINAGAREPNRRWGVDRFAELGRLLLEKSNRNSRRRLILLGGPEDVDAAQQLASLLQTNLLETNGAQLTISAAGRLSLLQSAALMSRCALVISGDTGPMHLAMAMQTPVLAINGPVFVHLGFWPDEGYIRLEQNAVCKAEGRSRCAIDGVCACLRSISPASAAGAAESLLHQPQS